MRYFDVAAAGFVALISAMFLWNVMGQALTGGVRLSPTVGGVVEPHVAIALVLWMVCSLWVCARTAFGPRK